jgi:putative hydrolase of the HAD superfamily
MGIRALIFDLDNCLSAADEVGRDLLEGVFEAIRRTNAGRLPEDIIDRACDDCWREPLDFVAKKYGFPDDVLRAAWDVNATIEVTRPMSGYGDLAELSHFPGLLFLVTSGFRRLQESKIRALGFAHLFTGIYIDSIDGPSPTGKQSIFERILTEFELTPGEVLVVGDNSASEIVAGNNLGITTIQILRPGVPPGTNATHQVSCLSEIRELMLRNTTSAAPFVFTGPK